MSASEFKSYVSITKLTFSYKPVLVLVLVDNLNPKGEISRTNLITAFRDFYVNRRKDSKPVERKNAMPPSPLLNPDEVSDAQIWQILARYPLPLMDEFITVDNDIVRIKTSIWAQMSAADLVELREIAQKRIEAYYEGVE